MYEKAQIMDKAAVARAIARISYEILERNKGVEDICIIGVLSKGAYIANSIAHKIFEIEGKVVKVGMLDITAFRDDKKAVSTIDKSEINFDVTDKKVVLVDDVIYTGRSTRAAIDALMKRGRPKNIQLAVLIDRGHREIPIRPDYVGKNLPTSTDETVLLSTDENGVVERVSIYISK
jgi:pyrimidine operon attenuation protein/uracil phosphoribosyltransferase